MKNRVAESISYVDVNPLDEPVNEKRYAQPNIDTAGIDLNAPISEPSFAPPPFKKTPVDSGSSTKTSSSATSDKAGNTTIVGGQNNENLSKKDLKVGAEAAADMAISAYEWVHVLGNKWLQISPKRLQRMQDNGEINLQAMIDYDANHRIPAEEFVNQYNQQVSNVLTVSDEFKEEIKPLLVELFVKRGVQVTLEQRIMVCVAKDVAAKGFIIAQQKQQTKLILNAIKDATAKQMAPPPQPAPQPQQQSAQQSAPQQSEAPREEVIVVEPEEFEVDNKSVVVLDEKKRKPKKYEI